MDQGKVKVMLNWPRLANVFELRGFLGLTVYYQKFVWNYGIIPQPFNFLKKRKFGWTEESKGTFEALKLAMATTPTISMPNFAEPLFIESDASDDGIGAVLSQQGRLVAFMS